MAKAPQRLRAGFLVHDVSRLRRTAFDQRVRPLGITRSQWWVLANLSRHEGEDMMQIELARLLDVGKVTLGGLIDRLEENGFVVRTPDKLDRRSKRVSVSPKGRVLVQRMGAIAMDMNAQIMRGIPAPKQRELEEMLTVMKRNLIEMDAVPSSTSGGNNGIGFAVPINLARGVMDSLIAKGKVVRGFLEHIGIDGADYVEITCSPKALGSGRWAALEIFSFPSLDVIEAFIMSVILKAGSQHCPPVVVGIGIGPARRSRSPGATSSSVSRFTS